MRSLILIILLLSIGSSSIETSSWYKALQWIHPNTTVHNVKVQISNNDSISISTHIESIIVRLKERTSPQFLNNCSSLIEKWIKASDDMRRVFNFHNITAVQSPPISQIVDLAIPSVYPLLWKSIALLESIALLKKWPRAISFGIGATEEELEIFVAFLYMLETRYAAEAPSTVQWLVTIYSPKAAGAWTSRKVAYDALPHPLHGLEEEAIVSFFDCDDFMNPMKVQWTEELFSTHSELDEMLSCYERQIKKLAQITTFTDLALALSHDLEKLDFENDASKIHIEYERARIESSSTVLGEVANSTAWRLGSTLYEVGLPFNPKEELQRLAEIRNSYFLKDDNNHEKEETDHFLNGVKERSWVQHGCSNGWPTLRRKVFDQVPPPYNQRVGEDANFNFRVIQSGFNFVCLKKEQDLLGYRGYKDKNILCSGWIIWWQGPMTAHFTLFE